MLSLLNLTNNRNATGVVITITGYVAILTSFFIKKSQLKLHPAGIEKTEG